MGPFSRQARVERLAELKKQRVELQAKASRPWIFGAIAIATTLVIALADGTLERLGNLPFLIVGVLVAAIAAVVVVAAAAARRASRKLANLERQIVLLEHSIAQVPARRGFWWRVFAR